MLTKENLRRIREAETYLERLNKHFKLSLGITHVPNGDIQLVARNGIILACYEAKWRKWHNDPKHKHGNITFNWEPLLKYSQEYIFEVVRHELAHAIVDMRLGGEPIPHGENWIRVAKLLRCDVSQYQKCCH